MVFARLVWVFARRYGSLSLRVSFAPWLARLVWASQTEWLALDRWLSHGRVADFPPQLMPLFNSVKGILIVFFPKQMERMLPLLAQRLTVSSLTPIALAKSLTDKGASGCALLPAIGCPSSFIPSLIVFMRRLIHNSRRLSNVPIAEHLLPVCLSTALLTEMTIPLGIQGWRKLSIGRG
jgi:hypothetical protein